jgi:hypothetical protein
VSDRPAESTGARLRSGSARHALPPTPGYKLRASSPYGSPSPLVSRGNSVVRPCLPADGRKAGVVTVRAAPVNLCGNLCEPPRKRPKPGPAQSRKAPASGETIDRQIDGVVRDYAGMSARRWIPSAVPPGKKKIQRAWLYASDPWLICARFCETVMLHASGGARSDPQAARRRRRAGCRSPSRCPARRSRRAASCRRPCGRRARRSAGRASAAR